MPVAVAWAGRRQYPRSCNWLRTDHRLSCDRVREGLQLLL